MQWGWGPTLGFQRTAKNDHSINRRMYYPVGSPILTEEVTIMLPALFTLFRNKSQFYIREDLFFLGLITLEISFTQII